MRPDEIERLKRESPREWELARQKYRRDLAKLFKLFVGVELSVWEAENGKNP